MISQTSVTHTLIGDQPRHCSTWDYNISPEGRHYFSVCAEGNVPEYVRFYEYRPETGEAILLFKLEDVIITYPRAIRASKIHSSIDFLPDGRVIMATHTTARAPGHPRWMPFAYYPHIWEGYPGSNIIVYDPAAKNVRDLGVPVQRESVYGGVYEAKTHSYYFSGYHRGHAYRLDLSSMRVTDFGQASEFGTWRYIKGQDGNLYSSTASGRMFRLNIEKQRIEDIGYNFPVSREMWNKGTNNKLMHYAHAPDGTLYFTALSCDELLSYDYKNERIYPVTTLVPPELRQSGLCFRCMGMDFDEYGYLWYVCNGIGTGAWLARVDPSGDKTPECMGLLGGAKDVINTTYTMFIRDEWLYAAGIHNSTDGPSVLRAGLNDLKKPDKNRVALDPRFYMNLSDPDGYKKVTGRDLYEDARKYYAAAEKENEYRTTELFSRTMLKDADEETKKRFYGDNAMNSTMLGNGTYYVTKIWQVSGYDNSRVHCVSFTDDGDIEAVCGDRPYIKYTIRNDIIINKEEVAYTPDDRKALADKYLHYDIPYQPERRHLAYVNAECNLAGGKKLIGTQDGMLALVDGDDIFSLGAVVSSGAVHDLAASPDMTKAAGVAGDVSDLGTVFTFDMRTGLALCGRVFFHDLKNPGVIGNSNEPCCVAYAPDGKSVAIGVKDQLGCVYQIFL